MQIGTASPSSEQLQRIPHYLINSHSVTEEYNAYQYEQDVLKLTNELFLKYNPVILTGGSMMYIDALCNGIDELPSIDKELRNSIKTQFEEEGIEPIRRMLKRLDPEFYNQVDLKNPKRVIHAVEVCMMTGVPYSQLRTNRKIMRPFEMIKVGLDTDRKVLYDCINKRVDKMIEDGLMDEAKKLYHLKHLNSLNTVGYKELFEFIDKKISYEDAIDLIKRNSRRYAKRQLSWFRRDHEITWFNPDNFQEIITFVKNKIE